MTNLDGLIHGGFYLLFICILYGIYNKHVLTTYVKYEVKNFNCKTPQ